MAPPLLATKLYIPPPRPQVVMRPRLVARLNEGLHRQLTLIAAPAGFGKTTLVSNWVTGSPKGGLGSGRAAAWLALDEGDNDPARFLTYLVAALQTLAPAIGAGVLGMLHASRPQLPPIEEVLTALLNDLATLPDQSVLVLDDYHLVDAPLVDQALTFLVEHLPPRLHLVISTREDPQLPLARLRARGQLTELRAADLRFTAAEAAEFLSQVMGLELAAADLAALEARTEGWIAGLQLAALSMQGHQDVSGFIRAFAGDHRYIVDYLVEEVLRRQPDAVRHFLLQTAILDRLNGPLCNAVTGQTDGGARLEALERGNFFVVPLDDRRHWYRYHHLFAEVLQAHLKAEQPAQVAGLHQRASAWHEQNGSVGDAIRHALAAKDFERAADLIERSVPAMSSRRQEATVLGWLQALPDEVVQLRPVLSVHYAWALLTSGELKGVEARLRDAERWLDPPTMGGEPAAARASERVVRDEAAFRRLPGMIAVFRASQAQARGDGPETVKYARQALDLIPEADHLWRGSAASLLGLASWTSGDLEAAHRSHAEGLALLRRAGNVSDAIGGTVVLADIRIVQGRLHDAMRTYEQAVQLATARDGPAVRGIADMHVGMSALQRERNDLAAATLHLLRAQELGAHTGFPQYPYRWRVAMALIRRANNDLEGALELLAEAERLYVSDFLPNVCPVAAWTTRVWIVQGRLADALGWAREQKLAPNDDLSYLREFEHLTLARLLLAQYQSDHADAARQAAVGLLERLRVAAEAGGRIGSVIEILVLQALAHHAQGNLPAALTPLGRALTLAEPEGYVRLFVEAGPAMTALLAEAAKRRLSPNYVRQLQTALGQMETRPPVKQVLIEPLTGRERELLRLLATSLTGPEIAQQLMVSLNTVRTHTRNVYTKLDVSDRQAAVRRAEELGLL